MSFERQTQDNLPQTSRTVGRCGLPALCLGAAVLLACSDDDPSTAAAVGSDAGGSGGSGGDVSTGGSSGSPASGGSAGDATGGSAGATGGSAGMGGAAGTAGSGGGGAGGDAGAQFDGMDIFRNDTFGDEQFWTDQLMMHEVIAAAVDPMTALSVGLKVDADALPEGILDTVDLEDPATTVALLELDAVIGVKGQVEDGELLSVGITCALCHSTVDDPSGIGTRIDGPANRDLDPGFILSLSPALQDADSQAVLTSWGPGRYDPYWSIDGENNPVLIPPIYGLDGVALETYTGEGPISYWNNYVAVTQMGGQGTFMSTELGVDIEHDPDLVTPKLPALFDYQVSLQAPSPPAASFDAAAAEMGEALFNGKATCGDCHTGPQLTDAASTLHDPSETDMNAAYAMRTTTGQYRTTPLRALFDHAPYFHDGSAGTLAEVVDHYDVALSLNLTEAEKTQLEEYLKSL